MSDEIASKLELLEEYVSYLREYQYYMTFGQIDFIAILTPPTYIKEHTWKGSTHRLHLKCKLGP